MIWLYISIVLMLASWLPPLRRHPRAATWTRIAFLATLFIWLWLAAGVPRLGGGEAGLLKWFAWGLGIALLANLLTALDWLPQPWPRGALLISALCYALGLDVLRQDAYARVPSLILGFLVLLVLARIVWRLWPALSDRGRDRLFALAYTVAFGLLVYAAAYKLIDRGWALPWSYLVNAGALSLALSQLWWGWDRLSNQNKDQATKVMVAEQIGQLLLITAAFFHYRQYF